eukprot:CAMPEP_0185716440 /NCGR_PEP_ID=MMETSP1164-20130828/42802_1 /TAXON_ID=1104430 /ORGANISM="Chrysoreinhardia sp, Strain CCMP2950" /LENGTH=50 /DNA_ID=CAMNT_0028384059 /DNA_START=139 /DNA_END=288 /DNA_ORIENTATION=+
MGDDSGRRHRHLPGRHHAVLRTGHAVGVHVVRVVAAVVLGHHAGARRQEA